MRLSYSALQTYERCPKKFKIEWIKGLEDQRDKYSDALENGKSFHKHMEDYANLRVYPDADESMSGVASAYLDARWNVPAADILSAEISHEVPVVNGITVSGSFDLVYHVGNGLIVRDYKTFSKAPTFDIDLDFQGRMYLCLASKIWPNYDIYTFEHEMVRTVPPGTPHGTKPVKYWTNDECYFHAEMTLSSQEMLDDWEELKDLVMEVSELVEQREHVRWRRRPQKGGGYMDCNRCGVQNLCKADKQGNLNESTIRLLGQKREEGRYLELE